MELIRKIIIIITLISFSIFVLIPSLFVLGYVILDWNKIIKEILYNPLIGNIYWKDMQRYLWLSFRIAIVTIIIDLLIGLPLAHSLSRKRKLSIVEDLITLTLVLPTSGFGFAVLITWSTYLRGGEILLPVVNIPLLILIVHIALTLPYVVRTLTATLRSIEVSYDIVSRSLGASSLTTFRKITLPMILPSLISSITLALTRSLGETGATLVVAGVNITASIAIVKWVFEFKYGPAALLSSLLLIISLAVLLPAEKFSYMKKIRLGKFYSIERYLIRLERKIPRKVNLLKDTIPLIIFFLLVIVPITMLVLNVFEYWHYDPYTKRVEGGIVYQLFGPPSYFQKIIEATITSFIVAILSTIIAIYLSLPLVFIIANSGYGKIIRSLLKIPLVIPTSALGLSSLLFWSNLGISPSIWLTILTHVIFSVPIIVETTLSTYRSINLTPLEETARTLGASPYDILETITLPLIKRGIIAGAILSFAHSLGETGATFLVMGKDITIPVLVVNMVEALAIPAALFTSTYLIIISLILLLIIRIIALK